MYIPIDEYDQFKRMKDYECSEVNDVLIDTIKKYDEENDLEKLILDNIYEPNRTAHGPAEIVDIFTVKISFKNEYGVAGVILKGKSFVTIRPSQISHQIFRLRKISDLKYVILGYVGNILDEAKDEFITTAKELGVDYTIIDSVDFARMAVTSGDLCPRDAKKIIDGKCSCGYRFEGSYLNFIQKDVIKNLKESHVLEQDSGIVIMPTGSGKTRVASYDTYNFDAKNILYIAHSHEILDSAEKEFIHFFGKDNVFRKIEKKKTRKAVFLITIQSIKKYAKKIDFKIFDYVIVDEFHHAAANSYRFLLEKISPKFLLGLTATPFRGDRQDVIELCNGNIIAEYELRTGIDGEILVPYHYYGCFDNVDYTSLKKTANGYTVKDLNKALIITERDNAIISKWIDTAEGKISLAFCCSVEHAERMSESFRNAGIKSKAYTSKIDYNKRKDIIKELQYGEIKVLCVVDVLNEGIDIPFVECLLFLRPTESKRIFFQQLGRGLRKNPGKTKVVVLDFIGNFYNSYRIVDYLGLNPFENLDYISSIQNKTSKEIMNLPLNCEVYFDDKVIELFINQILDPRRATRKNIAQILIFEYYKTSKSLKHRASKVEVDRYQLLHADFYKNVFGSWTNFQKAVEDDDMLNQIDSGSNNKA